MYGFGGLQDGANKIKIALIIVVGILLVALLGLGGYVLLNKKDENPKTTTTANNGKDAATTARVISKVSKLYDVPSNEEPTVAAIQDRTKLDGQKFFDKAKNGDYLLVYQKAELALIYREDVNKLINVGPITLQEEDGQDSADAAANPKQ